jgi:signal transduction histidine kinase
VIQVQAVDSGLRVTNMSKPKNRLFCRLDGLTPTAREQNRLQVLSQLGLLASETVPVFEEATQTASAFLDAPICVLGLVVEDQLWFKSAFGLSTIGLMNQLAAQRRISLKESFSTYIVDSQQPLVIDNTLSDSIFADSILTQYYGIRAYLGVPLISSEGLCIGTLEVMDWQSREFSHKDVDFLALTARWCLREFERNYLIKIQQESTKSFQNMPVASFGQVGWQNSDNVILSKNVNGTSQNAIASSNPIKVKLLAQLTQELRTPLTSVIGMASVLHREVYGPLTIKQREYLEIIHDSGQNLISLVDEIVSLGVLNEQDSGIKVSSIDIEMLCQQVINSLADAAKQHQQLLRLSIEPGNRIWSLDKDKVRQALYYLITSVLEMSEPGGEVKVHVSRRNRALNIAVWISHPWLGDGLAQVEFHSQSIIKALTLNQTNLNTGSSFYSGMSDIALSNHQILTSSALMTVINGEESLDQNTNKIPRDVLGLLFCCHLTELHEGQVVVQGSAESSYRYILQFPKAESQEE